MRIAATAILALLVASASPAQVPSDVRGAVAAPTAPWRVSGIGLGMRPSEVTAAMKAARYPLEFRFEGRSWQGELANRVSNLRGIQIPAGAKVVRYEDYRKGRELIHVEYIAGPTGPYVSEVIYSISDNAIDAERFTAAVQGRYGRPTRKWGYQSLYCAAGEPVCQPTGSLGMNQLPNLTVYVLGVRGRSLELRQGERADKAYEAAVKAEAERLYPKKDKPSF